MTKSLDDRPIAGPKTQSAPEARGGGTYGQQDFTKAAQRSKLETTHADDSQAPASDDPTDQPLAPAGPGDGA